MTSVTRTSSAAVGWSTLLLVLVIGCDGIVGSDKRPDACGVCGGDNSTCQIVSGIFTEPHLPHGYNLIAQLPKGACHINITVLKPTRNHLALRVAADGSFIINGNWDINWSGDYHAAGTTFKYTRQEALIPEFISSQGPLTEPVDMMVIANQVNPGIKYEYVIPIVNWRANGRSAANPSSAGINPGIPGGSPYPSLSSSGGLAHFGIVPQFADPSNPAPAATGPKVPSHRRNQRPHHGRHRSQDRAGNPRLPSDVQGTDPNTEGTNGVSHRRHKRAKFVWKQTGFTECSKTCGTGTQVTLSVCIKEDTGATVPERRCKEDEKPPAETVRCNTNPCPAEWVASEWSPCSVTCGEGVQTRDLSCKQEISPTLTMKVPEAACLSPPPTVQNRRTCNPGPCTTWRTSAWSKCSADCGKGLRYRKVHCTTEDGQEVNESLCRIGDRPADNEICDSGSCSSNTWFFSDWSEHCSEDCGNGLQSRKVVCTGTAESECDAAARPESTRTCVSSKDCSGKWFAGPWSQCSSPCNEGLQTREVLCLTFVRGQYRVGLDTQCSESERPETQRSCNSGPCASQWFMSDWSECSVTCGTGAQRREVKCLDETQRPSEDCLEEKRPPQRQACHSTPCAVETSQALADEETTNLEAKETESRDLPPANAESHRQGSKGSPKKSSRHRNQARLAVNQDTSGDTCVDKFKNCHLVVQARLCRLRYYLVSCCSSCTKQKP